MLAGVDLNSLIALRFDAMTAIGVQDGSYVNSYTAFLTPPGDPDPYIIYGPFTLKALCGEELMREIRRLDPLISMPQTVDTMQDEEERAILVGLYYRGEGIRSVNELEELAKTAGAVVLHKTTQNRKMPEPATYIGRGKAAELALQCQSMNANLVICDDELSAVQIKNLESTLGVKVIDRTTLILDIFSRHAVSREENCRSNWRSLNTGRPGLQEWAMLFPGWGGIGTRGPGEKKLKQIGHIHRRINEIESELARVKERRSALRSKREREGLLICALAGYTNSGKSTLLNALSAVMCWLKTNVCHAGSCIGDNLADGQKVLLIDTVGFIDKLPHDLVQAFHSTLEEVRRQACCPCCGCILS